MAREPFNMKFKKNKVEAIKSKVLTFLLSKYFVEKYQIRNKHGSKASSNIRTFTNDCVHTVYGLPNTLSNRVTGKKIRVSNGKRLSANINL